MKKTIAVLLCAAMMLGLLVGCSKKNTADSSDPTPITVGDPYSDHTPAGTLYLTFGAAIEILFDENGKSLEITGKNEAGEKIAGACQAQVGQGCVFAARAMLRYASDNKLLGDAKTVAVRLGKGEAPPSEDFLDTIVTDCQYLADEECTDLKMVRLWGNRLTEDGDLNADAAKLLASYFLDVEPEEVSGSEMPESGVYTMSAGDKTCTVDAFTGLVTMK